jgi:triosephosphate isomerase
LLAVPFTAITDSVRATEKTSLLIGAQNMHEAKEGAFTGEISSQMLKEAGAQFVLLGHSERRQIFKESNEIIHRKVRRAFEDQIQPVLCIGETLEQREKKQTVSVLFEQLEIALALCTEKEIGHLIVAYEPVWAIGTGRTATPEIAQQVHAACREWFKKKWGKENAEIMPLLYGGSVKPENTQSLLEQPDIDGVLVGGASLDPSTFAKIVNFRKIS